MGAVVQPRASTVEHAGPKLRLPRPLYDDSYVVQDLGKWVDRLFFGPRTRRRLRADLEPFLMSEAEQTAMDAGYPQVDVPDPLPGASDSP